MSQPIVRAFAGENRLLPDDALPDNVAVDGLNNDYSNATIRKRQGRRRLHTKAMLPGGVRFNNSSSAKCVWVPNHADYAFTADKTIEIKVVWHSPWSASTELISMRNGTSGGWMIQQLSATVIRIWFVDGSATQRNASLTFTPVIGTTYHVVARRKAANDHYISVDSTNSTSGSVAGYTGTTNPMFIGTGGGSSTPGNQTADFTIDEVRIWDVERTDAELLATRYRELTEDEIADTNLVGYWRLNEGKWNACNDLSLNRNHGSFYVGGPSFERSLLPQDSSDGFAARFDGIDDYASAPYHADYAPILNTSNVWTVEGWIRLDTPNYDQTDRVTILQMGSYSTGNGAAFSWKIIRSASLDQFLLSFSTTTTYSNQEITNAIAVPIGIPVHFATVRDGATITIYMNGQSVYSAATWGTENGPTSSTTYGMFFGARNSAGSYDANRFAPVTIDDIRVWVTARSQQQIQDNMNRSLQDVTDTNLVGYWRFDAEDKEADETGRSDISFLADGTQPDWSRGLVYANEKPRMLLCAPLTRAAAGNETLGTAAQFSREIVIATQTGFWSLIGNNIRYLRDMYTPGEETLFNWAHFRDKLVFCNGIEDNQKYDGEEVPRAVSIDTPSSAPSAATGAAGNLDGDYYYRVSFRNSRDGTESLASSASTVVQPSSEQVNLSSVPTSSDPQVNQRRIYRLDPSATAYRYLGDINDNTTTTYNDNTADITANDAINNLRGHAEPGRYCAVYNNRLFIANMQSAPSGIRYSEANDESAFTATNLIYVDRGDGDEITGIKAAFGGLVIFKQRSVHFLIGDGPTSWDIVRVVGGQGCVSGHTIAQSARGLYYLGYDGVYLMSGVGASNPISVTQQNLFKTQDAEKYRFAVGVYDAVRHVYKVTFDIAEQQNADYYSVQPDLFTNYWKFAGDATDETGDTDLAGTGTPTYPTDTTFGQVAELDGSSQYFSANYTTYPTAVTVGVWVNPASTSTSVEKMLMALYDTDSDTCFYLSHYVYAAPRFQHGNATSTLNPLATYYTFQQDQWYHVVGVRTGSIAKIFVNGQLVVWTTTTSGAVTLNGTGTFYIGYDGTTKYSDCKVRNAFFSSVAFTDAQVKEMYDYESGIGYKKTDRISMFFDEETNSWAKWDSQNDYLVNAAHSSNRVEVLTAENGFVSRLFDGYQEGSDYVGGYNITRSGTTSANTTNTISDSSYVFSTIDDGLAGTPLLAVDSTSGATQKRIVTANTGTALYLNKPFQPSMTGTWYLGVVDWFWESRWMDLGDPAVMKRLYRLMLWVTESSTPTITIKWKSEYNETWQSTTSVVSDEFIRLVTNHRGRKFKLRLEARDPTYEDIEMRSFQFRFAPRLDV